MKISVVCPMYNEAEVLEEFFSRLTPVLDKVAPGAYEIVCVDDGSVDATVARLCEIKEQIPQIRVLKLSRNFGKEAAMSAGIDHCAGEVVIPIDADLQDPPELIEQMYAKYLEGFHVVLAKRKDRSSDSFLKRVTAESFYKVHNKMSNVQMPDNVGDFRLMSRQAVEAVCQLNESQRFMKGLFSWVGYPTATVEYVREERAAGDTKFNGWKLWNFAIEGITSFSTAPLKIWTYMGLIVSVIAFLYATFIVSRTLILGVDVPGYASLLTVALFLGGIQLIGIGVIGEYVGRIYMETKNRPNYIVHEEL